MKVSRWMHLGGLLAIVACAADPGAAPAVSPPRSGPQAAPSSATSADPAPPVESPREKLALRALGDIQEADAEQAARIAASELSEEDHGLSPLVRRALGAVAGEGVDPSQRARIIGSTFDEDAALRAAFDSVCRPGWNDLALAGVPEPERLARVEAACKGAPSAGPHAKPPHLSLAVALAIAVERLLDRNGGTETERKIARALVHLD